MIGIFPVIGTTTMLCLVVSLGLRLNPVAIQLTNWLVYPAQLLLIIPFVTLGSRWFGSDPIPLAPTELADKFSADFLGTLAEFGHAIVFASVAWATFAIPGTLLLAALLYPVIRRMHLQRAVLPASTSIP